MMKRSQTIKTWLLALALAAGFSLGQSALANASTATIIPPSALDLGCSNASLDGVFSIQGSVFFVPPGDPVPFSLANAIPANFQNVTLLDGQGALRTQIGVATNGGLPPEPVLATGTYTVHPDCTGELHIESELTPGSMVPPELNVWITVINEHKFNFTFIDDFVTGSGTGERIGDLP